jgi:hypothetical protein
LGKHIKELQAKGLIERYEEHDRDGYPDYSIWLRGRDDAVRIECKNVRDAKEAYKANGKVTAYKVETQKTRAATSDKSSRFYGYDQFEILAVCLGKKTHDWTQFMYIQSKYLPKHSKHRAKMAVMHRVPLPSSPVTPPWYTTLEGLLEDLSLP